MPSGMIPNRCSLVKAGRQCPNPPQYALSVTSGPDEYMVGVACNIHKDTVSEKILHLQSDGSLPKGAIRLERLHPVGTDCIRGDPDDIVMPLSHDDID